MIYPDPARWGGNPEISGFPSQCIYTNDADWNVTFRFAFSPHQQVRNASGDSALPFPFVENQGVRYGPSQEESDPAVPTYLPLNAPFTWDFMLNITDSGGGEAIAEDEFGFYKYQALTLAGTPGGGLLQGQGPPMTPNIPLSPQNAVVNFSSNCELNLSVYVTDLVGGTDTIPATDLSTEGGDLSPRSWFLGPGPGNRQFYLGGPFSWYPSLSYSRYSTSSSFGLGTPINWWVDIGNVIEDTYPGTVTYTLGRPA